jgi:glycosyltransferase involved in cell wall biosynthesis
MSLYRELGFALGVKVIVPVWFYKKTKDYIDNRNEVGFRDDEYADMTVIPVGENYERGLNVLDSHPGWTHLFCNYQGSSVFRRLQMEAVRRGEKTAIGSEAPCNMFNGCKQILKEIYFRTLLPLSVAKVIGASQFFVNYSGADDRYARIIGWERDKIIPFGYFSPPIPGTRCIERKTSRPFEILATGSLTWHRGSDVLIKALKILKERGVAYHATVTQNGPLADRLKQIVHANNLPIDFPGFVPLDDLKKLYGTCSVYVGSGRSEPWGMRLNDALNCGAPLVVSRGMGGVKMVDDYKCGLAFENEDYMDLADKLQLLASDQTVYAQCADNAVKASHLCSPKEKAAELVQTIKARFPQWLD